MNTNIKNIIEDSSNINLTAKVFGIIRYIRKYKKIIFISIFDGSYHEDLQLVIINNDSILNIIDKLKRKIGIMVEGKITLNPKNNTKEIFISTNNFKNIKILNSYDCDFPIQKNKHSMEYLRENYSIRNYSNFFQSLLRIKSIVKNIINRFFIENNFMNVDLPSITFNDAEGAGEVFKIQNINFFSKSACLNVSNQLYLECISQFSKRVYTMNNVYRADKSKTTKHAAEFIMLEAESLLWEIGDVISFTTKFLQFLGKSILDSSIVKELKMWNDNSYLNNENSYDLGSDFILRLKKLVDKRNYITITYDKAVLDLQKNGFDIKWGDDFTKNDEQFLISVVYKDKFLFITMYPWKIKSFYMKTIMANNRRYALSADLIFSKIGEIMGSSERESSAKILVKNMEEKNIRKDDFEWYLDLRKYGFIQSSGFGIGYERIIMYITGLNNIKDIINFPRTYQKYVI